MRLSRIIFIAASIGALIPIILGGLTFTNPAVGSLGIGQAISTSILLAHILYVELTR